MTQDAWVPILRNISGFGWRSSLEGWMFAIVRNKVLARASRNGRMVSFNASSQNDGLADAFDGMGRWKEMPELWNETTPERIAADKELLDLVTTAIETLPTAQRAVLMLHVQKGFGARDVARILGIRKGNMRVHLHRARSALRVELDHGSDANNACIDRKNRPNQRSSVHATGRRGACHGNPVPASHSDHSESKIVFNRRARP